MPKKKEKPARICGTCIHEYACSMWNVGTISSMDAKHCDAYENLDEIRELSRKLDMLEFFKARKEAGKHGTNDL